jgi:acyl CoA:acetate/3-ketoacid CoA transferase alpha subunit
MTEQLRVGKKEIFCPPDPDSFRDWVFEKKSLAKTEKLMDMKTAVEKFVADGNYLKLGGFGQVRTSMSAIYEIIRQKKRDLAVAGHTTSHDLDVLLSGGCVARIEVAYCFAHELRPGKSCTGPRLLKEGKLEVSEWSNASFAWRLKAAALGLSFIPARSMLGTDTCAYSGAREIICPFTNQKYLALPALYPDVAIVHVHRADKYGNAQIDGMLVSDDDAVRAARRVIITAEEIVDENLLLQQPQRTVVPYFYVDAVVESPFGAYPCEMPDMYWFDEYHMAEYVAATKTEESLNNYFDKYFYSTKNWLDYVAKASGGSEKLDQLKDIARGNVLPPRASAAWGNEK